MTQTRLIVIGPLPPPLHGVTISTSVVLGNATLRAHFDVTHVDTSDHRSGRNVGRWDIVNAVAALRAVTRLLVRLRGRRGVVYLPLSQSTPGLLRDSLFVLLAHTLRWRVAAHLRGSDFRSYYEASSLLWQRWIQFTLRRIDSIAVMGETLRWMFHGLVSDERIAVVPNGTPEPAKVDIPRDPSHILFLSNLLRRKGIVEAVEAALLVLEQLPSAHFTFAGSWESDELKAEVFRLADRVNGRIEFKPAVEGDEKDRLLASAALFLFPPVEPEGHPRVVLEALAAGLPVVTTDRGAIRETVVEGQTGYVLEEPEPRLLADRMLKLLKDRSGLERFGLAARQSYLVRFTQDRADRNLADWLMGVRGKSHDQPVAKHRPQ